MKKIMLCGGGSAGHVMPNIALFEQLSNKYEFCYIGTRGIEKDICKKFGVPFRTFDGVKFVRGKLLCNLKIPFLLSASVKECRKIIADEEPDLVFCKGGYASLPPALAAQKMGIPVIAHESDMSAGLANKIISKRAKRMLASFPTTAKKFKNGIFTGSPMRECIFNKDSLHSKHLLGLDLRPTVLVFGGGSGSRIINETLRKCLLDLCRDYNVIHVCGKGNFLKSNIYGYIQMEFCDDMGLVYSAADYAVARCGSNSAHELIALKIPTLFIPLENGRSRGDQIENAEYFRSLGLCKVLREKQLNAETLKYYIRELIADKKIKTALSLSSIECGNKNIEIEIDNAVRN